ncbi:S1 family peptidase [Lysobacter terrae]
MVLSNILFRTFFIKAEQYGTAFTLEIDGSEYLITARHLVDTSKRSFDLRLFLHERWHDIPVQVVGHGRGEIDITVLKLPFQLTKAGELEVFPTIAHLALGQDIYFLGFPYKMWGDVGEFMGGMPCAYAKKGTISSLGWGDPQILHVDAINNEGFSGGPLFFYPHGQPTKVHLAGVVSKFKIEFEQVVDSSGNDTGMTVAYNTGFLVAYGSKHILGILEAARHS